MRGFSTIEIVVSLAVMSIVFSGVILADFSATYWRVSAQTHSEGLYKARALLERVRAAAGREFAAASSTSFMPDLDTVCEQGGLCYYTRATVSDVSLCLKQLQAEVAWPLSAMGTATLALPTVIASPARMQALGGDCALAPPSGEWEYMLHSGGAAMAGAPVALDALGDTVYLLTDQAPYLHIYRGGSVVAFSNGFAASDPANSIEVARDPASGRTYAYLAMASTTGQLAVVDVTNPTAPQQVARIALVGVDPGGQSPQGWRLAYWDTKIYILTRNTAGPELHVVDVSAPASPLEQGSGLNLTTSAYAITVLDVRVGGAVKRLAYLAVTRDTGELVVADVSNPAALAVVSTINLDDTGCALTDKPDGSAVLVLGSVLYVGREHSASCPALTSLYAFSIANPLAPVLLSSGVTPGAVIGLAASGDNLFVYASTQASPENTSLLDLSGDAVYLAQRAGRELEVWRSDPADFVQVAHLLTNTQTLQVVTSQ